MGFGKDFLWGVATSSYQIEGGAYADGKGLSVWDAFCREPEKVFGGHTGDVACDHYHLFREDIRLMASLQVKAYRFSVNWPRVLPQGTGTVNEKGIAFYDALIDCLLENGIDPLVTLFHWEYPEALQEKGAWLNPDSPKWFADYARLLADRFGDRVKNYLTLNEPQCFIGLGYGLGAHAPGLKLPLKSTIRMSHRVMLAHGLAVAALRDAVKDCRVGYAPCSAPAYPVRASPADIEAARQAYFAVNPDPNRWYFGTSWWSDPVMLGSYPEEGLKLYGQYLPEGFEKDLPAMHQRLDWYGHNIYNGVPVRAGENGPEEAKHPEGMPKTAMDWPITPECMYWGPKFLFERYHTPILITENGMAGLDAISLDGAVHDPNRIDYLHRYLKEYRRAAETGIPLAGYFQWSFMDNFEWAKGYNDRFGLVYVDYATQRRIPKDSAYWYKQVIELGGENL